MPIISDTAGDQIIVQFSTTPKVCFCTIWGNKTNKILHFYSISPVRIFPGIAEADLVRWESEWSFDSKKCQKCFHQKLL